MNAAGRLMHNCHFYSCNILKKAWEKICYKSLNEQLLMFVVLWRTYYAMIIHKVRWGLFSIAFHTSIPNRSLPRLCLGRISLGRVMNLWYLREIRETTLKITDFLSFRFRYYHNKRLPIFEKLFMLDTSDLILYTSHNHRYF
jgi:hypothetical protein